MKFKSRLLTIFACMVVAMFGLVFNAGPAQAYQNLCGPYGSTPSFACVSFSGYSGQSTWGYPADNNGHNCTRYAAYRLAQNGASDPGNLGNAMDWDNNAASKGFTVNNVPAIGSIAQWEAYAGQARESGHVAYVETVTSTYIEVSEDNYDGTASKVRYNTGQSDWPSHFLHIKDVNSGTGPTIATSYIASATNADGTIEVFAVGVDHKIYVVRQNTPSSTSWWNSWGVINANAKSIAVTKNLDGRLQVFYVGGDNAMYYRYQQTANVDNWSAEVRIAANLPGPIAAGTNGDGTVEVFAVADTGNIVVLRQTQPNSDNWWSNWGTINANARSVAVTNNADGRLQLSYIGANNGFWYRQQQTVSTDEWTGETTLQGNLEGRIATGKNLDGTIEVFARGINGQTLIERQNVINSNNWWSSWGAINANGKSVAVASNADGRLQVFSIGTDGSVYHRYQQTASVDNWSVEYSFGGNFMQ